MVSLMTRVKRSYLRFNLGTVADAELDPIRAEERLRRVERGPGEALVAGGMIRVRRVGHKRSPRRISCRCRVAVGVGEPDRRDRAPEAPVQLVGRARDQRVGRRDVQRGEHARPRLSGTGPPASWRPWSSSASSSAWSPSPAPPPAPTCRPADDHADTGPREGSRAGADRLCRVLLVLGRGLVKPEVAVQGLVLSGGSPVERLLDQGLVMVRHAGSPVASSAGRPGWPPRSDAHTVETPSCHSCPFRRRRHIDCIKPFTGLPVATLVSAAR